MRRPALLLLAATAIAAPSAQAAYPGANGKLVFFQQEVGGVDPVGLAVSDADGRNQNLEPLGPACGGEGSGAPGACPEDPIWSPDGTRIAFGLGGTVATMKPDGTDVRRLALTGFTRVTSPAWSPDGAHIAFSALRGKVRNVYVTNVAAAGPVVSLTKTGGGSPAWSVRGEIAFTRRDQVLRMPATGGKARRLTTRGGSAPTWSPDGEALAFVRSVRLKRKSRRRTPVLFRLRRDGRRLKRLTRSYSADPSWTPAGTAVLFHDSDSFNLTIRSVPANGGKNRLVTSGEEGRRVAALEPDQQPLPR